MSKCRATPDGYRTDQHFDECADPGCRGCFPCVPTTDHGDPLEHCTARARCSEHVETGILSCPRCVGKTRAVIRRIADLTPLLPVASVEAGRIDSEAFNLAGPAADPAGWSATKVKALHDGTIDALPDDDPAHPLNVLGRWQMMIEEDYAS